MSRRELIRLEHITKVSGGIKLLDDFSLLILSGEHIQVTGLSGSGIEALGSILAGQTSFDSGSVIFEGRAYGPGTPLPVDKMGIYSVFGRSSIVPQMRVAENIFTMRKNRLFRLTPSKRLIRGQARQLLDEFGVEADPDDLAQDLGGVTLHALELIKAYARNAKLIVAHGVNGPYPEEHERIFTGVKRRLREAGIALMSVSTNPFGVLYSYDRTIVMRDGSHAKTVYQQHATREDIMKYAVSGDLPELAERQSNVEDDIAFSCENVSAGGIKGIDFNVHRGEVTGLFDAGSDALMEDIEGLLTGALKPEGGRMLLGGESFLPRDLSHCVSCGLGYINGANFKNHLIGHISVLENIMLPSMKKVRRMRFFRSPSVERHLRGTLEEGGLRGLADITAEAAAQDDDLIKALILFHRWGIYKPKLLLYYDPFAHADAVLRLQLANRIEDLTSRGIGVLVLSPRLRDLAFVCDRILFFKDGGFVREYRKSDSQFQDLPVPHM